MSTATIQSAKVHKEKPTFDVESCVYLAGDAYVSDPIVLFDPPRPILHAKGSLDNEQLRELAKKRVPPASWFEGEEEELF